jgi:hypothetical protein
MCGAFMCFLTPFGALALAIVAQPLVTWALPQVQNVSFAGLSADSYIPMTVGPVFAFLAGFWLRHKNSGVLNFLLALVAPTACFAVCVLALTHLGLGWNPLTAVVLLTGVLPMVGLCSGWSFGWRAARLT